MQRIESGRLRGRRLMALPKGVDGLRPTAARVRGAIYDRLGAELVGARVLDLFAGSGAISLEALSRGAQAATLVEANGRVVKHLQAQMRALGLGEAARVVRGDAARFLTGPAQAYDLVVVDPPFSMPTVFGPICARLVEGWLAKDAVVVCERELVRGKSPLVDWPPALQLESSKSYGQALVEFLRFVPAVRASP